MARPRKDVMKPQEIDHSRPVKTEGGMAHSVDKVEDMWGGKKPPLPRSELNKDRQSIRSGMGLIA